MVTRGIQKSRGLEGQYNTWVAAISDPNEDLRKIYIHSVMARFHIPFDRAEEAVDQVIVSYLEKGTSKPLSLVILDCLRCIQGGKPSGARPRLRKEIPVPFDPSTTPKWGKGLVTFDDFEGLDEELELFKLARSASLSKKELWVLLGTVCDLPQGEIACQMNITESYVSRLMTSLKTKLLEKSSEGKMKTKPSQG